MSHTGSDVRLTNDVQSDLLARRLVWVDSTPIHVLILLANVCYLQVPQVLFRAQDADAWVVNEGDVAVCYRLHIVTVTTARPDHLSRTAIHVIVQRCCVSKHLPIRLNLQIWSFPRNRYFWPWCWHSHQVTITAGKSWEASRMSLRLHKALLSTIHYLVFDHVVKATRQHRGLPYMRNDVINDDERRLSGSSWNNDKHKRHLLIIHESVASLGISQLIV